MIAVRVPVFVPAYAKINLTLDVVGRRDDGFHLLRSVMQTIALHDTIALTPRESPQLAFACDNPDIDDGQNLALRAAQLVQSTMGVSGGMSIELHKSTPLQAGLGGGSSDAGAVLVACAELWRAPAPQPTMLDLAARLGSDVPFFLTGGTALVEGRGERVEALPDAEPLWLLLVKPDIGLSTRQVFEALLRDDWSDGSRTQTVVERIRAAEPLQLDELFNALEPGVLRTIAEVARARDALRDAGASVVRMSGSGPTLFAPFRRLAEASGVAQRLRRENVSLWLTRTVPRAEYASAIRPGSWLVSNQ